MSTTSSRATLGYRGARLRGQLRREDSTDDTMFTKQVARYTAAVAFGGRPARPKQLGPTAASCLGASQCRPASAGHAELGQAQPLRSSRFRPARRLAPTTSDALTATPRTTASTSVPYGRDTGKTADGIAAMKALRLAQRRIAALGASDHAGASTAS